MLESRGSRKRQRRARGPSAALHESRAGNRMLLHHNDDGYHQGVPACYSRSILIVLSVWSIAACGSWYAHKIFAVQRDRSLIRQLVFSSNEDIVEASKLPSLPADIAAYSRRGLFDAPSITSNMQGLRIVWWYDDLPCCEFNVVASVLVSLMKHDVEIKMIVESKGSNEICQSLPADLKQVVESFIQLDTSAWDEVDVLLFQSEPIASIDYKKYPEIFTNPPRFVVARPMIETMDTDPIVAEMINKNFDEVWVQALSSFDTFATFGVDPKKMFIMPDGFDCTGLHQSYTPFGSGALARDRLSFVFLSVINFEVKNGWDILVRAFLSEFSEDHDVSLVIKTSTWVLGADAQSEALKIREALNDLVYRYHLPSKGLQRLFIVTDNLNSTEMRRLHSTADVFVLSTRNEGWCRPLLESMALGIPAIVTKRGSHAAFVNDDNAFQIETVGARRVFGLEMKNSLHWWEPSIAGTRQLMRRAYQYPAMTAYKGRKARNTILENYCNSQMTELIVNRLSAIVDQQRL